MYDRNSDVMVKRILLLLAIITGPMLRAQLLPNYGEERAGLSAFTYLKSPVDPWSAGLAGTALANTSSYGLVTNPALLSAGNQQGMFSGSRMLGGSIGHDFFSYPRREHLNQVVGISINSLTPEVLAGVPWQPQGIR